MVVMEVVEKVVEVREHMEEMLEVEEDLVVEEVADTQVEM